MKTAQFEVIKTIVAAGPRSYFHGKSGTYGDVFADAITKFQPRPGGFKEALESFAQKRRIVIVNDTRSAFLSDDRLSRRSEAKHWKRACVQLLDFDKYRKLRPSRQWKFNFSILLEPRGPYRRLYSRLAARMNRAPGTNSKNKIWSPEMRGDQLCLKRPPYHARKVKGGIRVIHSSPSDVPAIMKHLGNLWDIALTARTKKEALKAVACFEWWFFACSPTGRCAAAIGDALALSLQLKRGLKIRERFRHMDWEVLHRSLDEYVAWRCRD